MSLDGDLVAVDDQVGGPVQQAAGAEPEQLGVAAVELGPDLAEHVAVAVPDGDHEARRR